MLAKKVDKCPDARADGSVTVVNRAERHFNRQALLGQQFNKLPARNFLVDHIIGQTGNTIPCQA